MPQRLADPKQSWPWIHPDHRGDESPTVFYLTILTEGQSRKLEARSPVMAFGDKMTVVDPGRIRRELFLTHCERIENVVMPGSTEPETVEGKEALALYYDLVPASFMGPVYEAIQNSGKLEEGLAKNFAGSSGSAQSS